MVLGNRIRTRWEAFKGNMPWWKYVANRLMTSARTLDRPEPRRVALRAARLFAARAGDAAVERNSDDFVFDQQFLYQAAAFRSAWRRADAGALLPEASSINFRRSCVYGLATIKVMAQFALHRCGLVRVPLFAPRDAAAGT